MSSTVFRGAFLTVVACGIALFVYWFCARPSQTATRLGLRGLKRERALRQSSGWASVEPLVRWFGARVHGLLPPTLRKQLDRDLCLAGDYLGLTAEEYVGVLLLSGTLCATLAGCVALVRDVSTLLPYFLVGFCGGIVLPLYRVSALRAERLTSIRQGLPYATDLLALALGAGADLPAALTYFVEKSRSSEALREEFSLILHNLNLGQSRAYALRQLFERAPIAPVQELVMTILQAEERGNPVAATIQAQAVIARTRRSNEAELMAERLKAGMVVPNLILAAIPLYFMMQLVDWVISNPGKVAG